MTLNQAQSPSRSLEPGSIFDGRYMVISHIGAGGMANVYKVRHLHLDQIMALKLLRQDMCSDARKVKRFKQEAKMVSALTHPNLVNVQGFGIVDGTPYLVMDFVEGDSLDMILDADGAFPFERVIAVAKQAAAALGFLHANRIVHRDIKPGNLISTADGVCKVVDFGVAKVVAGTEEALDSSDESTPLPSQSLTQTGTVVGTPAYMSPEQSMSSRQLDGRSDIYSLGCVLFELATGKQPYSAESHYEMLAQHMQGAVPSLADTHINFEHEALDAVLQKCMAKDPAARFQTMEELAVALVACEQISPRITTGMKKPAAAAQRHSAEKNLVLNGVLAGIGSILVIAIAVLWFDRGNGARTADGAMHAEDVSVDSLVANLDAAFARRDYQSAVNNGVEALRRTPPENANRRGRIDIMVGSAYLSMDSPAAALPYFQDAVKCTSRPGGDEGGSYRNSQWLVGSCYSVLLRWEQAVQAYAAGRKANAESANNYEDYAQALFNSNNIGGHVAYDPAKLSKPSPGEMGAIEAFRMAQLRSHDHLTPMASDSLAASYMKLRNFDEAEKASQLTRRTPGAAWRANHRMAMIRLAQGDLKSARAFEERSLNDPTLDKVCFQRRDVLAGLGLIAFRQGDFETAARRFDDAYKYVVAIQPLLYANPAVQEATVRDACYLRRAVELSKQAAEQSKQR